MSEKESTPGILILDRPEEKTKFPPNYIVFVHNDDFTPREFVVDVLKAQFSKSQEQAAKVMLIAHNQGKAAVGHYTKEIAETKAANANAYCRAVGRFLEFSYSEE